MVWDIQHKEHLKILVMQALSEPEIIPINDNKQIVVAVTNKVFNDFNDFCLNANPPLRTFTIVNVKIHVLAVLRQHFNRNLG